MGVVTIFGLLVVDQRSISWIYRVQRSQTFLKIPGRKFTNSADHKHPYVNITLVLGTFIVEQLRQKINNLKSKI